MTDQPAPLFVTVCVDLSEPLLASYRKLASSYNLPLDTLLVLALSHTASRTNFHRMLQYFAYGRALLNDEAADAVYDHVRGSTGGPVHLIKRIRLEGDIETACGGVFTASERIFTSAALTCPNCQASKDKNR